MILAIIFGAHLIFLCHTISQNGDYTYEAVNESS